MKCTILTAAWNGDINPTAASTEYLLHCSRGHAAEGVFVGCSHAVHSQVTEVLSCTGALWGNSCMCPHPYLKRKQHFLLGHKTSNKAFQVMMREVPERNSLCGECDCWNRLPYHCFSAFWLSSSVRLPCQNVVTSPSPCSHVPCLLALAS